MHSVLIVGCGSIGERHLRCFQQTLRAKVAACEVNPDLLAAITEKYRVPGFGEISEALAKGFEAVVICTPAHLHLSIAAQALEHRSHVLIEKPLSHSFQGVEELIAQRDRSGRHVSVAYILHVYPLFSQARDFLRSGELGAVRHATSNSGQYFPGGRPAHAVHYSKTYYRDRRTGGGAIQDALTHTVNWVESVVGPTDSVICDCSHQVLPDVAVEDTVNLSTRNGDTLVNYTLNQFQAPNESTLQFNTPQGSVKIEPHQRRWGICRQGEVSWKWHEVPPAERDAPFIEQANRFLDQLEGKPSSLCSLEAAAQTLRVNLAALQSSESDTRVHCAGIVA